MKKKLALLLSLITVFSAIPISAQTSDNRLTRSSMNLPNYTLLYESGITTGGSGRITGNPGVLEYWVDGSDLVIEVRHRIPGGFVTGANGIFRLTLDNARFFFRNNTYYGIADLTALPGPATPFTAATLAELATRYPNLVTEAGGIYSAHNRVDNRQFTGTFEGGANTTRTFDVARGAYADHRYLRFGRDAVGTQPREIPYIMEVSMANESAATVIILEDALPGDLIRIPIVSRTSEAGTDVTVSIDATGTSIQSGRFLLASGMGGRTSTRALGSVTSRTDFTLREIVITEQRINTLRNGASFELIAPSGFYFGNLNNIQVHVEPGLSWVGDRTGTGRQTEPPGWISPPAFVPDVIITYRERAGRIDRSAVQFNMLGLRESLRIPGRIIVTGATLIADDVDMIPTQGREISLTIRNMPGTTSYTEETFVVGRMSDYLVTMERRGEIRELISGRLDTPIVRGANGRLSPHTRIDDDTHRAADVRIEETIPNSWWAQRNTEFRLPEGVKILQARFLNLNYLDADSVTALTNNPESENAVDFFNTGSRTNSSVLIRDNVLNLSRLRVTSDTNRARFDVRLWLNIDVEFYGDIDLTLSGTSVMNVESAPSVTIARAIRPIEVHTRVSDIRIGYQFVSVADFDIVENVAGALRHGETVYVSVTDEISVDMHLAPGLRAGVTEGNIRISNVMLRSALGHTGEVIQGQLRFDVERESSVPSTISFTDVQVKAATHAPFSNVGIHNQRGINLIVWGPAVAQNFEGLMSGIRSGLPGNMTLQTRDFFPSPGIRAHYINVITPAPGGTQNFTNEVRASIGNPIILINGNQYTIPVAPYVSPASNSTMVPVRFISLALGLPENAVRWDPAHSTVTIDAGNRIVQFQTGSYHFTVNGVMMPMVSPDGLPVAMEIREERSFVPFRALGEAFGIRVSWEQETSTAVFNARF